MRAFVEAAIAITCRPPSFPRWPFHLVSGSPGQNYPIPMNLPPSRLFLAAIIAGVLSAPLSGTTLYLQDFGRENDAVNDNHLERLNHSTVYDNTNPASFNWFAYHGRAGVVENITTNPFPSSNSGRTRVRHPVGTPLNAVKTANASGPAQGSQGRGFVHVQTTGTSAAAANDIFVFTELRDTVAVSGQLPPQARRTEFNAAVAGGGGAGNLVARWRGGVGHTSTTQRLALRVDSSWFVTSNQAAAFTQTCTETDFAQKALTHEVMVGAAQWLPLTINGELVVGTGAPAALPAGEISGFGVYSTITATSGSDVFIDTFEIELPASSPTGGYSWGNVRIGGGGFITGLVIHPTVPDLIYTRTDVGGCYRWDPVGNRWIPLMDMISWDEHNLYGVDGIALDRNNPDIVYIAAGKYSYGSPADVLKSTDRGVTWQRTGLNKLFGANEAERWAGERVAVDPHNSSRVMAGTLQEGLWISTNAGGSWSQAALPSVAAGKRVNSIFFDPRSGGAGVVYVGVKDTGLFRSTNSGSTWSQVSGAPATPHRMAMDAAGNLFVTSSSGFFRLSGSQWTNLSPAGSSASYNGLSIHPTISGRMLVSRYWGGFNNGIYLTNNGGSSWTHINSNLSALTQHKDDVVWAPDGHFASAVSSLTFDPHQAGRVWMTEWYSTWMTPDLAGNQWYRLARGHEEIVTFDLISPSSGAPLHSAVADVGGFRHTSFTTSPTERSTDRQDTISLDWAETNPNLLVRAGGRHGLANQFTPAGYSTDNGLSWTNFPSQIGNAGRVAISSNGSRIVWMPFSGVPRVSTDFGTSWQTSTGAPAASINSVWDWRRPLVADRADPNKFYYYNGGKFYRSDDGGLTWTQRSTLNNVYEMYMNAVPGQAGGVWVSLNNRGLFRSSDGGNTFTKLPGVTQARLFAFGRAPSAGAPPAVFLQGKIDDVAGIYRSDDLGGSWVRINPDDFLAGNNSNCMTGDRQVWGRVYIGTNGRGIFVGETTASGPGLTAISSPPDAGSVALSSPSAADGSTTLTATPELGFVFAGWSGGATGDANPLTLSADQPVEIVANFSPDLRDPDGDGLSTHAEVTVHGTDPAEADTSGDGIPDGTKVSLGLDPLRNDSALVAYFGTRGDLYPHFYTLDELATLALKQPFLFYSPEVAGYALRMGLQVSRDLQSWTPLALRPEKVSLTQAGELELVVDMPTDVHASFYRLQAGPN